MKETSVFIKTSGSVSEVADIVGSLIGASWREYRESDVNHHMSWHTGTAFVMLDKDSFVDDLGIPFSEYPFYVLVDDSATDADRIAYARSIFEKLKAMNVPLMLVDDMEVKLDEWTPPVPLQSTDAAVFS